MRAGQSTELTGGAALIRLHGAKGRGPSSDMLDDVSVEVMIKHRGVSFVATIDRFCTLNYCTLSRGMVQV